MNNNYYSVDMFKLRTLEDVMKNVPEADMKELKTHIYGEKLTSKSHHEILTVKFEIPQVVPMTTNCQSPRKASKWQRPTTLSWKPTRLTPSRRICASQESSVLLLFNMHSLHQRLKMSVFNRRKDTRRSPKSSKLLHMKMLTFSACKNSGVSRATFF